jgi:alkanesulfonate monooxygenase SsuD/methylene tetrahydromethanopterin reductase-like flavin-dependent oxidoreductase (luciferase family)
VFVTLARLINATRRVTVYPAFANNLARSPVEFAHASLTLQEASNGRFEAALGSGWERSEIVGLGLDYPEPAARARRFREAILIARAILDDGACEFHGEFYEINIARAVPRPSPTPPLVAALAGPWTIRHIGPLVDRIELAIPGPHNPLRSGALDVAALRRVRRDDLAVAIDQARAVNPTAPLSAGLLVAAGAGPAVDNCRRMVDGGFFESLTGDPRAVADQLAELAHLGLARITVMPLTPDSIANLGPFLHHKI